MLGSMVGVLVGSAVGSLVGVSEGSEVGSLVVGGSERVDIVM